MPEAAAADRDAVASLVTLAGLTLTGPDVDQLATGYRHAREAVETLMLLDGLGDTAPAVEFTVDADPARDGRGS